MIGPKINAGNVTLRVTPEELVAKAEEVLKEIVTIKQNMDTIQEKVDGTKGYWIGEAGELHRKLFNDQKEAIDDMMRRLNEHPRDLKTIAGTYKSTESQVTEIANALTDNVII